MGSTNYICNVQIQEEFWLKSEIQPRDWGRNYDLCCFCINLKSIYKVYVHIYVAMEYGPRRIRLRLIFFGQNADAPYWRKFIPQFHHPPQWHRILLWFRRYVSRLDRQRAPWRTCSVSANARKNLERALTLPGWRRCSSHPWPPYNASQPSTLGVGSKYLDSHDDGSFVSDAMFSQLADDCIVSSVWTLAGSFRVKVSITTLSGVFCHFLTVK